tara:strand:+ start:304 stop:960 length:657 start_codon:yes stop_codon:yes gene_type:complete
MIKLKDLLVENPISTMSPPKEKGGTIAFGHINYGKFYLKPLEQAMKELYTLCRKVDIVATDFDDRELLKPFYNLGDWKKRVVSEPILTSVKKLDKALKNPKKNFKEPNRVINALPTGKSFPKLFISKYKKISSIAKNLEKFNNQKVSQVFPKAKQSDVGNQKIGSFMNDDYLTHMFDIKAFANNKKDFDFNLSDAHHYIKSNSKSKSAKPVVIGNVKK